MGHFVELEPEWVLLADQFPEVIDLLLPQQDELPLLGVRGKVGLLLRRSASLGGAAAESIHCLALLPLAPDEVAGIDICMSPQGPPGTTLEDTLHKQSVVALADKGTVLAITLRGDEQSVGEADGHLELPCLEDAARSLLCHVLAVRQMRPEVEFALVHSLPLH